jgi:hypothetical protein
VAALEPYDGRTGMRARPWAPCSRCAA